MTVPTANQIDRALQELGRFSADEARAVVDKLEAKRRDANFAFYWDPQEQQRDAIKLFQPHVKVFGILGGNRAGKTELGAFIAVAWALGKDVFRGEPVWELVKDLPIPKPPNNIWVVGLDFSTLRDVIWREKFRQGRDHPPFFPRNVVVKEGDFQAFWPNGSVITGKSADSGWEKFQGASVDLVWIDEECEERVFDECYQRTLDCAGKILLTLTPLTDIHSAVTSPWVFDLYEEWKKGRKDFHFAQLSLLNNPHVPEEEKKRAMEKWAGHPEEKARLYGEFVQRSGLVYPTWDAKKHRIKPFEIPSWWPRIVSIDPAATGVTAAVWAAISPEGWMYLYREYYEKDRIVSEHAKGILLRCGGDPIDFWLLDPTWGKQRNAENHKQNYQLWREAGIPVRLPDVGDDYGLNVSREYLNATVTPNSRHPKLLVFEGLPAFEDEITHYTWDSFSKGPQKGLSKEKPRKRNDHLMNAWQYLCAVRPKGRRPRQAMTLEERLEHAKLNSYT